MYGENATRNPHPPDLRRGQSPRVLRRLPRLHNRLGAPLRRERAALHAGVPRWLRTPSLRALPRRLPGARDPHRHSGARHFPRRADREAVQVRAAGDQRAAVGEGSVGARSVREPADFFGGLRLKRGRAGTADDDADQFELVLPRYIDRRVTTVAAEKTDAAGAELELLQELGAPATADR